MPVQGIATGKYHAAVLTNCPEWEAACVKAGKKCGDLVHPLVYCPELHFSEFNSAVADMKNSVAVGGPRVAGRWGLPYPDTPSLGGISGGVSVLSPSIALPDKALHPLGRHSLLCSHLSVCPSMPALRLAFDLAVCPGVQEKF